MSGFLLKTPNCSVYSLRLCSVRLLSSTYLFDEDRVCGQRLLRDRQVDLRANFLFASLEKQLACAEVSVVAFTFGLFVEVVYSRCLLSFTSCSELSADWRLLRSSLSSGSCEETSGFAFILRGVVFMEIIF